MQEVIKLSVIAIIAAILAITVKKQSAEFAILISIITVVIILFSSTRQLFVVMQFFSSLSSSFSFSSSLYIPLLKVVGVCIVSKFSADLCRDLGESSIASKIEFFATTVSFVMILPLFLSLINLAQQLL